MLTEVNIPLFVAIVTMIIGPFVGWMLVRLNKWIDGKTDVENELRKEVEIWKNKYHESELAHAKELGTIRHQLLQCEIDLGRKNFLRPEKRRDADY